MKNYAVVIILLISILSSHHTMAQRQACIMPDNGYWQLVTRGGDRHSVTVRFYDLASHLVCQQQMTAVPNWHNKKICRMLAESLQTALAAASRERYQQPSYKTAGFATWSCLRPGLLFPWSNAPREKGAFVMKKARTSRAGKFSHVIRLFRS
jgi:hypothetical protein